MNQSLSNCVYYVGNQPSSVTFSVNAAAEGETDDCASLSSSMARCRLALQPARPPGYHRLRKGAQRRALLATDRYTSRNEAQLSVLSPSKVTRFCGKLRASSSRCLQDKCCFSTARTFCSCGVVVAVKQREGEPRDGQGMPTEESLVCLRCWAQRPLLHSAPQLSKLKVAVEFHNSKATKKTVSTH